VEWYDRFAQPFEIADENFFIPPTGENSLAYFLVCIIFPDVLGDKVG
jgi:hypothetical protein